MVTIDQLRKIASGFPEVSEEPHFEKTSFRVRKKIFVSCIGHQATIKLSEIDQSVFCSFDREIIYPVDSKWGRQGWTIIEMDKVNEDLFTDAITTAYCTVAPRKLAESVRPD